MATLGLALLAWLSLRFRPLIPVDETRYAAVAWEMWQHDSFLVPLLNGADYDHKPPLLFWLIHAGWWLGGVSDAWPRLIGPLSSLLCLWLLRCLGERLWPQRPAAARLGSLLFLASTLVSFYQGALMFEMPLLACILWSWIALHDALDSGAWRHWLSWGAALGLGLLVKGPVVLLFALPPLLLSRLWSRPTRPRLATPRVALAALLALALPLLWLLAAMADGSAEYFQRLLFDQTLHRVSGQMGHPRPWYWYLPMLLPLALPWSLWPAAWRGWGAFIRERSVGQRFVLTAAVPAFALLSLIGGKQIHYLLPLLALAMLALGQGLLIADHRPRVLDGWLPLLLALPLVVAIPLTAGLRPDGNLALWLARVPTWTPWLLLAWPLATLVMRRQRVPLAARNMAVAGVLASAALMWSAFPGIAPYFDLTPTADAIARAQADGRPVLYVGNYQGEFGFLGRLREPVLGLPPDEANDWIQAHPDALVVVRDKRLQRGPEPLQPQSVQPFKTGQLQTFSAADLLASGSRVRDPERHRY
ncbi:MAG: glycosyltransferase family 39 protein [Xanthomonadales bacterium]|nr:glycosyltransferase family 39 protein [Xanthomonadales bacterium]